MDNFIVCLWRGAQETKCYFFLRSWSFEPSNTPRETILNANYLISYNLYNILG